MTLEEIKDMVLFCREHGVTQLKIGEVAMVIEPLMQEMTEARLPHPFDKD